MDITTAQLRRCAISNDTLHPIMQWNVPLSAERHTEGVPNYPCHWCRNGAPCACA